MMVVMVTMLPMVLAAVFALVVKDDVDVGLRMLRLINEEGLMMMNKMKGLMIIHNLRE